MNIAGDNSMNSLPALDKMGELSAQQKTQIAFNKMMKEYELDEMNDHSLELMLRENGDLAASLISEN